MDSCGRVDNLGRKIKSLHQQQILQSTSIVSNSVLGYNRLQGNSLLQAQQYLPDLCYHMYSDGLRKFLKG